MEYEIIYEKSSDGWSAHVPELPGCTFAGADKAEIEKNIYEAIELHLELLHFTGKKPEKCLPRLFQ